MTHAGSRTILTAAFAASTIAAAFLLLNTPDSGTKTSPDRFREQDITELDREAKRTTAKYWTGELSSDEAETPAAKRG